MSSGRFRFVGGSHELQKSLAVLVDLHRSYPADLTERIRRLRPPNGDLEQRPVGEDDVSGNLLLARDAGAQRAQLLEETCIRGARNELGRLALGGATLAACALLLAGLGLRLRRLRAPRSAVRAGRPVTAKPKPGEKKRSTKPRRQ